MQKYHLATYGCQMNVYDSNMIAEMLEKRGLQKIESPDGADIVVVNTCSIRGGAEDRAYARIAAMRYYKKLNPSMRIAVVGCMAQNHGEKIPVALDHVNFVVGPDNYRELEEKLFEPAQGIPAILTEQSSLENYDGLMAKLDSPVSTHITIMRGCNKQCTYCIVPLVRGVERSRDPELILEEVQRAVAAGVKEVCLLGQTVNSYRTEGADFAGLLRLLNEVEGLARIRFTSPHPRHFDAEVIAAMAECPKVCGHVHLPLQSGSNRMLKKMRRQYTREKYLAIVENLRAAMPGIGITTDIITGFVGETESDFEETLSFMQEVRFDSAFMFSYSPREGTPAFAEPETLSAEAKQERLERVIALQTGISEAALDAMVGGETEVMLEGPSARSTEEWIGKSDCFKKVVVPAYSGIAAGDLVRARIAARKGTVLRGELLPSHS